MIRLDNALHAWGTPQFEALLKQELVRQAEQLPLQEGLSSSSSVAAVPISVLIRKVTDLGDTLQVKAGIMYQGVIGGCSCTDDPTPDSTINEYCDVLLDIDKTSATATVTLLAD